MGKKNYPSLSLPWEVSLLLGKCLNSHPSLCLTFLTSDNYGFVTYRYAEEAFAAIESGHKLRQADEQPFDLCFGGRRQFCKRSYSDLGEWRRPRGFGVLHIVPRRVSNLLRVELGRLVSM